MSEKPIVMLKLDNKSLTSDLDRAGYKKVGIFVKQAPTYAEGLEKLKSSDIDIILINMDLPRMNIKAALRDLKNSEHYNDQPIIVTSVQGSSWVQKRVLDGGADLFVEQPYPRQTLVEKIKALLSQQTRTTQRVSSETTVEFSFQDKVHYCEVGDISNSGILVMTDLEIPSGESLELKVKLPEYKRGITIMGEVVRTVSDERGVGIGIRFEDFKGDARKRLDKFITKNSSTDSDLRYYL